MSSDNEHLTEEETGELNEAVRAELGREPTEEELDEWLRQHTEGY